MSPRKPRGRIRTLAKYALALIPVLAVLLSLEGAYRFAMFDLLVPAPPQVDPASLDRFRRIGARVFFLHDDHLNDCGQDVLAIEP